MNETLLLDDLFRQVWTGNLLASLPNMVQPVVGAARENSMVLHELAREGRRGWEFARARHPGTALIPAVMGATSPVSYQASIQLKAPVIPPRDQGRAFESMAKDPWTWFITISFGDTAVTTEGCSAQLYKSLPGLSRGNQVAKAKDDVSLRDHFASAFQIDPEGAVEWFVEEVERQPGGGLAAARVFLPYLVGASYAQQNLFLDAVLQTCAPDDVLRAAMLLAEGSAGEAILEAAAGILEHFGERSWPALANLAARSDPRCRHFVRAVGYIPTADPQARIEVLVALAKNPDLDTRWLAAAVAEDVSPEAAAIVWRTLSADPDEELRATAQARVASLMV